jgi:prepilin-type N-terminal cleavage/methylation domain-containing protein
MNAQTALPHRVLRSRAWFRGFSLVEMMACVSIIGIVAFLAIPSVTRYRTAAEENAAIAAAEGLNLGQASFVQMYGRTQANAMWQGKNDQQRYELVRPYLSFSAATLSTYLPSGYSVSFPGSLLTMDKVTLNGPTGVGVIRY